MKIGKIRRSVALALAFVGLLTFTPCLAGAADAAAGLQREAAVQQFETLLGKLANAGIGEPVFEDLGGGFYAVSMSLTPELRARLQEEMGSGEPNDKAQAASLTVIAVGQAPVLPPTPVAATHGALSDTTFPYAYWVISVNLGTQTVTKSTTFKLTGPGLKFTKSAPVVYGAGGIWGISYSPGSGVRTPGIYTFQGSVSGGGSITTKTFAVNP